MKAQGGSKEAISGMDEFDDGGPQKVQRLTNHMIEMMDNMRRKSERGKFK